MKKFIWAILFICSIGCENSTTNRQIDKILTAKATVRNMVNYPDTLSFHEFDTNVSGNVVTLKFTCKNGFGVPETHTVNITVH